MSIYGMADMPADQAPFVKIKEEITDNEVPSISAAPDEDNQTLLMECTGSTVMTGSRARYKGRFAKNSKLKRVEVMKQIQKLAMERRKETQSPVSENIETEKGRVSPVVTRKPKLFFSQSHGNICSLLELKVEEYNLGSHFEEATACELNEILGVEGMELELTEVTDLQSDVTETIEELCTEAHPSADFSLQISSRFCSRCYSRFVRAVPFTSCPFCTPVKIIPNVPTDEDNTDPQSSMPPEFILLPSAEKEDLTIVAAEFIPRGTVIGPLQGEISAVKHLNLDSDLDHAWPSGLLTTKIQEHELTLTHDPTKSNWLRYLTVNSQNSDDDTMSNVSMAWRCSEIYFIALFHIKPGEELILEPRDPRLTFDRLPDNDDLKCDGCNILFSNSLTFTRHLVFFHKGKPSLTCLVSCPICGVIVQSENELCKHTKLVHNCNPWICEHCDIGFKDEKKLKIHLQGKHAIDMQLEEYKCSKCPLVFFKKENLEAHLQRHNNPMHHNITCVECDKVFASPASHSKHVKIIHQRGDKPQIMCDHCGKHFINKSNLKVHLLTHSGVKPFQCSEKGCKAAYTTKQCLQIHYRKQHNYTDDTMPLITRAVPFTIQAHTTTK